MCRPHHPLHLARRKVDAAATVTDGVARTQFIRESFDLGLQEGQSGEHLGALPLEPLPSESLMQSLGPLHGIQNVLLQLGRCGGTIYRIAEPLRRIGWQTHAPQAGAFIGSLPVRLLQPPRRYRCVSGAVASFRGHCLK